MKHPFITEQARQTAAAVAGPKPTNQIGPAGARRAAGITPPPVKVTPGVPGQPVSKATR